jgi:NDP-sugar pyrophosphorylase family protein
MGRRRTPARESSNGGQPKITALATDKSGTSGETKVVILAGGRGTRLAPYTSVLPKPLMPIGSRSILEIVVGQLEHQGFVDVVFSVGYLSHLIKAVFDHAPSRLHSNVHVEYVHEESPLGTAGSLRLVPGIDDSFIVMNGDVLTTLDYRMLLAQHRASGNALTIAAHVRTTKIDYGVLHLSSGDDESLQPVIGYLEKPEMTSVVSMGVYVLEPSVLEHIRPNTYLDFPVLVEKLLANGDQVGAFLYDGLWFDIGRQDDYERAAIAWENGSFRRSETSTEEILSAGG